MTEIQTQAELVDESLGHERSLATLLSFFGALALLASIGLYGTISYAVSRRTGEIGIRMSLGAGHSEVLQMVMSQGMRQAFAGILTGIAAAVLLSRLMVQMLFGVQPTDPLTFVGVSAILILTALAAIAIPARKALRVEPIVALRTE